MVIISEDITSEGLTVEATQANDLSMTIGNASATWDGRTTTIKLKLNNSAEIDVLTTELAEYILLLQAMQTKLKTGLSESPDGR